MNLGGNKRRLSSGLAICVAGSTLPGAAQAAIQIVEGNAAIRPVVESSDPDLKISPIASSQGLASRLWNEPKGSPNLPQIALLAAPVSKSNESAPIRYVAVAVVQDLALPLQSNEGKSPPAQPVPASEPALQPDPDPDPVPEQVEETTDLMATRPRSISFAVPLIYNGSVYGDVLIEVGGEKVLVEAASLRTQLAELLNEAGSAALEDAIDGREFLPVDDLEPSGFVLGFDDNRLELLLEAIDGNLRPTQSLFNERSFSLQDELPVVDPAGFSAYLNVNGNVDYNDDGSVQSPDFFIFGATRFNDIVVELDGAFSGQFGPDYGFFRRSLRAVYDQPDNQRRFTAGDVRLATIPLLRTPFIGGISVEKRRQIFDTFNPITRLNGREFFLDSRSTVNVLLNGEQFDSFQLDAGRYDLANLPLRTGANGVELEIIDSAGRRQLVNFDYFFEPLDLGVDESEYAFSMGFISREFNFEPEYTNDPIAAGFYRRRLNEFLILGGAAEISEQIQTLGTQMTLVPQVIPGVVDLELGASFGNSTGFAARGGYRINSGNSFSDRRQFSITFDYEGRNYETVGEQGLVNAGFLNVTASYSQSLSQETFVSAGAAYATFSGPQPNRLLAFADIAHRLNDRFRLTAGVEYGDDALARDNFGVRVGIQMLLGQAARGNADYRSRNRTTRVAFSQGGSRDVGAVSYDVGVFDAPDASNLNANLNYVGNRFDVRASAFTNGSSFGNITDRRSARLQFGTSLAVADGIFGIGRPISDSFAVIKPNPSVSTRQIISGRDLSGGRYFARSGTFGAAVQSDLNSYFSQTVRYDFDLEDDGSGLAIGDGVTRVEPPFRSGYKIIVGDVRFVSVAGTLLIGTEPAGLLTGTITSTDDEGFETLRFFTNSSGRFAIIGIAPGKTYQVSIPTIGRNFEITVPEDNNGVLNLGQFSLPEERE